MDAQTPATSEGRFILLEGVEGSELAAALVARLPHAASVDGAVVGAMFDGGENDLERTFLRYTAGIGLADSFRLAGFDAVVAEHIPDEHLETYLDFASPTPVYLIHIGSGPADAQAPGLHLTDGDVPALAEEILTRLPEALVDTADREQ